MRTDVKFLEPEQMVAIYPGPDEEFRRIDDLTRQRVDKALTQDREDTNRALHFGAFSYLVELVRLQTASPEMAVRVAEFFLSFNESAASNDPKSPAPLTYDTLRHFANRILEGGYDWDSFLIAFLDPEAVAKERLRENLELTPSERYHRYQKLMRQVHAVQHAKL